MPSPYARQRPVRRDGAGSSPARTPHSSLHEPRLPDAGLADDRDEVRLFAWRDRSPIGRPSSSSSLSRPTKTRRRPPTPRGRIVGARRDGHASTTPRRLPLRLDRPCGRRTRTRRAAAATVRSPTSTSPGSAAFSSRSATFTASPVTNDLPSRARRRPPRPVLTPIRSSSSSSNSSRAAAASRAQRAALARRDPRARQAHRRPPSPHPRRTSPPSRPFARSRPRIAS